MLPGSVTSFSLLTLADLAAAHFSWGRWERLIERRGVEIDRAAGTAHPDFPEIIYPLDYGFVPGTHARADGEPVDCFRGSAPALGLVGGIATHDHRREQRELNLLYGTTPPEVYCAHGFLAFAPRLLESALALRQPMPALWEHTRSEQQFPPSASTGNRPA